MIIPGGTAITEIFSRHQGKSFPFEPFVSLELRQACPCLTRPVLHVNSASGSSVTNDQSAGHQADTSPDLLVGFLRTTKRRHVLADQDRQVAAQNVLAEDAMSCLRSPSTISNLQTLRLELDCE